QNQITAEVGLGDPDRVPTHFLGEVDLVEVRPEAVRVWTSGQRIEPGEDAELHSSPLTSWSARRSMLATMYGRGRTVCHEDRWASTGSSGPRIGCQDRMQFRTTRTYAHNDDGDPLAERAERMPRRSRGFTANLCCAPAKSNANSIRIVSQISRHR